MTEQFYRFISNETFQQEYHQTVGQFREILEQYVEPPFTTRQAKLYVGTAIGLSGWHRNETFSIFRHAEGHHIEKPPGGYQLSFDDLDLLYAYGLGVWYQASNPFYNPDAQINRRDVTEKVQKLLGLDQKPTTILQVTPEVEEAKLYVSLDQLHLARIAAHQKRIKKLNK